MTGSGEAGVGAELEGLGHQPEGSDLFLSAMPPGF